MIGRSSSFVGTRKPMWNRSFAGPRWGASGQAWNPRLVGNLAAHYDASDTGSLVYDGSKRTQLTADKSGNSGVNAFVSDGAASNTATSPNVSTTGSRTFAFDVALTDYTPASDRVLVNKLSGNDGHSIVLLTTGVLRLRVGNGASVTNVDSTVALSITDLARGQFTIVWTDGVGASFTQNGAALGTAVAAAVTMTNAAVANTLWALTAGVFYSYTCGTYNFIPSGASKLAPSFVAPITGETWTINTSGATGARICGARDLYQGTAANQAIYLPWNGTNYGYLNGVSGNVFTTPDAAFPTGDLELIFRAKFADWTPSSNNYFGSKYDGGTQNTFYFALLTSGILRMGIDPTGAALVAVDANAATGITDGDTAWIRVTVDVDNGAGGCNVAFYKASDQGDVPSSWTQIGTTVTSAGVKSFFNSTTPLLFGGLTSSSGLMSGNLLRGIVKDGIGGTTTYDFNPALYTSGTTFTASTGEVWTINGGAAIVARTCLYYSGTSQYLKSAAFALAQPTTVYLVGSQVGWTINDALWDGGAINTMQMFQGTTTPNIRPYSGGADSGTNVAATLATNYVISAVYNGASGLLRLNRTAGVTQAGGSNNANGFTLGGKGDGTAPTNITVSEVVVYAEAHDTATQNRIALYLGRKWGIAV